MAHIAMFASFTLNQTQYLTTKCPNLKGMLVEDLQVLTTKKDTMQEYMVMKLEYYSCVSHTIYLLRVT